MRTQRRRTKKLIVAFHFYRSGHQAGWRCDECRRAGLERRRNCGYLGRGDGRKIQPVWAQGEVWTSECPRSFITPESVSLLDAYAVWELARAPQGLEDMRARVVDALITLRAEARAEQNYGDRKD